MHWDSCIACDDLVRFGEIVYLSRNKKTRLPLYILATLESWAIFGAESQAKFLSSPLAVSKT